MEKFKVKSLLDYQCDCNKDVLSSRLRALNVMAINNVWFCPRCGAKYRLLHNKETDKYKLKSLDKFHSTIDIQ